MRALGHEGQEGVACATIYFLFLLLTHVGKLYLRHLEYGCVPGSPTLCYNKCAPQLLDSKCLNSQWHLVFGSPFFVFEGEDVAIDASKHPSSPSSWSQRTGNGMPQDGLERGTYHRATAWELTLSQKVVRSSPFLRIVLATEEVHNLKSHDS